MYVYESIWMCIYRMMRMILVVMINSIYLSFYLSIYLSIYIYIYIHMYRACFLGCLKEASKPVQVLFHAIEAVIVLTLTILSR